MKKTKVSYHSHLYKLCLTLSLVFVYVSQINICFMTIFNLSILRTPQILRQSKLYILCFERDRLCAHYVTCIKLSCSLIKVYYILCMLQIRDISKSLYDILVNDKITMCLCDLNLRFVKVIFIPLELNDVGIIYNTYLTLFLID